MPRLTLLFLLFPLLTASAAAAPQEAATARRPNVVILLADDLGTGDISCYGGWIPTPNIDRLAKEGALFHQAYAPAPVCTPSRAGLFTGLSPARLGVQANTGINKVARKRSRGMPGEAVTFAERLKPLGYRSGLVGKWHLGLREEMTPVGQGFEEFFGFLGPSHAYMPDAPDAKMLRNDTLEEEREQEYLTDAFARESEAFLARNRARPFVLTVAFNAPHNPYEATEKYLQRFAELEPKQRTYAAMVSALDDAVGRILAALETHGLAENTLVFFASDNGATEDESPGSNAELEQGKAYLFEGGIRVPLLLRWPGHVAPGTQLSAPVSLLDLGVTALAQAGAPSSELAALDGRDLTPLLAGEPPAERVFLWKLGPAAAIRRGDQKLIVSKTSQWLFDLGADPREQFDLSATRPELLAALNQELESWIAGLPEQGWTNEALAAPVPVLGKPYWIEY